jgi:hypothetical protein
MFIDLIVDATKRILHDDPNISHIVANRLRKEVWFQEQIHRIITQDHPGMIVSREKNTPNQTTAKTAIFGVKTPHRMTVG